MNLKELAEELYYELDEHPGQSMLDGDWSNIHGMIEQLLAEGAIE